MRALVCAFNIVIFCVVFVIRQRKFLLGVQEQSHSQGLSSAPACLCLLFDLCFVVAQRQTRIEQLKKAAEDRAAKMESRRALLLAFSPFLCSVVMLCCGSSALHSRKRKAEETRKPSDERSAKLARLAELQCAQIVLCLALACLFVHYVFAPFSSVQGCEGRAGPEAGPVLRIRPRKDQRTPYVLLCCSFVFFSVFPRSRSRLHSRIVSVFLYVEIAAAQCRDHANRWTGGVALCCFVVFVRLTSFLILCLCLPADNIETLWSFFKEKIGETPQAKASPLPLVPVPSFLISVVVFSFFCLGSHL